MKKPLTIQFADHSFEITSNNETILKQLIRDMKPFHILSNEKVNFLIHIESVQGRKNYKPITNLQNNSAKILVPEKEFLQLSEVYFNIKIVIAQLLITKGYLLLHASGFIKNNALQIMSAPSGTGKSTTCKIAAKNGYQVVCDDSVLVSTSSSNPIAYTTPYIETHKKTLTKQTYRIGGIYFLQQSKNNKKTFLSKTESIQSILQNSYLFQNSPEDEYLQHYFNIATKLAVNSSCYKLEFTKDARFLDLI